VVSISCVCEQTGGPSWGSSSSSWSSSGKSGKSGSASDGGGWYGNDDDDWAGGGYSSSSSKPESEPVSAPTHPTGWKDDGWDNDGYYKADIEDIRQECAALIEHSERELLPKILRLAFHSCVGSQCDGCINKENSDNRGLAEPVEGIYPMVRKYSGKLSRADVWAICAMEAASMAVPGDARHFPLNYIGRQDCEDGDDYGWSPSDNDMCSNEMTNHEMLEFFAVNFGLNDPKEVAAIMGVHSIGVLHRDVSGFGNEDKEHGWVENADDYVLSNRYYTTMLDKVWELEKVENEYPVSDQYQWYFDPQNDGPVMLTSDLSLVLDFEGYIKPDMDGIDGLVMCSTHIDAEFEIEGVDGTNMPLCPMAEKTKEFVELYAEDNEQFIHDFGIAMNKIMNWGYHTYI
jgi:catalase (peroxidase I)